MNTKKILALFPLLIAPSTNNLTGTEEVPTGQEKPDFENAENLPVAPQAEPVAPGAPPFLPPSGPARLLFQEPPAKANCSQVNPRQKSVRVKTHFQQ